jgi:glycosyltransferase involved in cell wall biosynthesis
MGSVASEEVGGLLARARALVFPSKSFEGMPRAVLEAYAAGVPVLASDVGALPEIVLAGETGLLVAPHPEAWASAMARLGDDDEARRLGQRAHEEWRDRYSPERGLPDLVSIYRAALAGRPTKA